MDQTISLSPSEWRLMDLLWEESPRTVTQLLHISQREIGWSKATILTMLSRLEAKGAVTHEEGGRAKRYVPLLRREDAARAETENFLSKVYGGSLGLMMSAMAQSKALTEEDIAELSAILERAGGAQK